MTGAAALGVACDATVTVATVAAAAALGPWDAAWAFSQLPQSGSPGLRKHPQHVACAP